MAVTAALVFQGKNTLRYLLTQDGGEGTTLDITATGAATPDLLTDSLQGPIKKLAKVVADGFQTFAAGAQTQAKARALWLSDFSGAVPGVVATTAMCRLTPRSGTTPSWRIDANVSAGNPLLSITAQAGAGTCYLDIDIPGAIGA
jgi:hypothetical protein